MSKCWDTEKTMQLRSRMQTEVLMQASSLEMDTFLGDDELESFQQVHSEIQRRRVPMLTKRLLWDIVGGDRKFLRGRDCKSSEYLNFPRNRLPLPGFVSF